MAQIEIQELVEFYGKTIAEHRTREVGLLGRKCQPRIQQTFLGFEVKMGNKRVTCPDRVTAQYLSVFGELGMKKIRIPYDPTLTAKMIPFLEQIMENLRGTNPADQQTKEHQRQTYRTARKLLREVESQWQPLA